MLSTQWKQWMANEEVSINIKIFMSRTKKIITFLVFMEGLIGKVKIVERFKKQINVYLLKLM